MQTYYGTCICLCLGSKNGCHIMVAGEHIFELILQGPTLLTLKGF